MATPEAPADFDESDEITVLSNEELDAALRQAHRENSQNPEETAEELAKTGGSCGTA